MKTHTLVIIRTIDGKPRVQHWTGFQVIDDLMAVAKLAKTRYPDAKFYCVANNGETGFPLEI